MCHDIFEMNSNQLILHFFQREMITGAMVNHYMILDKYWIICSIWKPEWKLRFFTYVLHVLITHDPAIVCPQFKYTAERLFTYNIISDVTCFKNKKFPSSLRPNFVMWLWSCQPFLMNYGLNFDTKIKLYGMTVIFFSVYLK